MSSVFDSAAVLGALDNLCKWSALPSALLTTLCTDLPPAPDPPPRATPPEAPGADAPVGASPDIRRLQAHLVASIPTEWRVDRLPGAKSAPATINAQAVAAPRGAAYCLGGRTTALRPVRVSGDNGDAASARQVDPEKGLPDCSQVYQAAPAPAPSPAVTMLGVTREGAWAAAPARVDLMCGLHGHSAVLYQGTVYIWGGQMDERSAQYINPDHDPAVPYVSPRLRLYRLSAEADQPVVEVNAFQQGQVPVARMLHRAAVDAEAGVMYMFGGVRVKATTGARAPADRAGWVHSLDLTTFTWRRLETTGAYPATTTLCAFFWHGGHLWAIPDGNPSNPGAAYRLHRLDPATQAWQLVATTGKPPPVRSEACSVYAEGCLMLYGGSRTSANGATAMLGDVHCLHLEERRWERLQPVLRPMGEEQGEGVDGGAMLPLAGHAGAALRHSVVFWGGYCNPHTREAQQMLQVMYRAVAPAGTAPAAASDPNSLPAALQHCRQRLARLLTVHDKRTVVLLPDGGPPVRMPVLLLALYSPLFDDMFQDMLGEADEADGDGNSVPLPDAPAPALAVALRWVAGLASLDALAPAQLADVFRLADRLVLEPLMQEALQRLLAHPVSAASAPPLLRLASSLPGRQDVAAIGERAEKVLLKQVTLQTAPDIMALAVACGLQQLKEACIHAVYRQAKNDAWAVVSFACRFGLTNLQSRVLRELAHRKGERLLRYAERISKAAHEHRSTHMLDLLSRALLTEFRESGPNLLATLPQYVAAAELNKLELLFSELVAAYGTPDMWRQISTQALQMRHLRVKCPKWVQAAEQRAGAAS